MWVYWTYIDGVLQGFKDGPNGKQVGIARWTGFLDQNNQVRLENEGFAWDIM